MNWPHQNRIGFIIFLQISRFFQASARTGLGPVEQTEVDPKAVKKAAKRRTPSIVTIVNLLILILFVYIYG
jgi:hypothetical protein